jgi:sRNA-binding regulator protein Hfq
MFLKKLKKEKEKVKKIINNNLETLRNKIFSVSIFLSNRNLYKNRIL